MLIDIAGLPEQNAIEDLAARGVIQGYSDGTFRPDGTVNRAEFITILMESRFPLHVPKDLRCFPDLDVKTPQWYAKPVCAARELGIVGGYRDGMFRPDRTVNLAEALKMAFRSFGIMPVDTSSKWLATRSSPHVSEVWYTPYLNEARSRRILVPLLKSPSHTLTRAEMASLTYALLTAQERIGEYPAHTNAICGDGAKEGGEQCDDGNTSDGDGCSSICINVPEPIRRAFLQLAMQAGGTVTSLAQGQRAVPLLKFTAVAGRQDVLLTSLLFTPSVGSLLFAQHYTLAMDRDGTGLYKTIVQTDGRTDGTHLIFDHFTPNGIRIPKGLTVPFILRADLVSTLGPVSLGLQFATDEPEYVQAQGKEDGLSLTGIETDHTCTAADCFIRVNTVPGKDITVIERGNLWVTQDTTPAPSHLLLGGSITPALLRLRLRSDGEDIDVRQIRIDGVTSGIDSLLLYQLPPGQAFDQSVLQPFAQASSGQCSDQPASRLCAVLSLSTLLVHPDEEVVIAVAAHMKNDRSGGRSGDTVTLSLSPATNDAGASVLARGISSLQQMQQNNGDAIATGEIFVGTDTPAMNRQITGRTNDTTFALLSSIVNGGLAKISAIPTGNAVIGAFTLSAAAHTNTTQGSNDVVLKTMTFSISAQNVQIDPAGYRLTTSDDAALSVPCSGDNTTGSISVICTSIDAGSIRSHLSQGQWMTYQLRANVTNTAISPGTSSLLVELPVLGNRSQTNAVIWSDEVTTFSWVDVPLTSVGSTAYGR